MNTYKKHLPREPRALAREFLDRAHIRRSSKKSVVSFCRDCKKPSAANQVNFYSTSDSSSVFDCFDCVRRHFPHEADKLLAHLIQIETQTDFTPPPVVEEVFTPALPPEFSGFIDRLEACMDRFCEGVDRLEEALK